MVSYDPTRRVRDVAFVKSPRIQSPNVVVVEPCPSWLYLLWSSILHSQLSTEQKGPIPDVFPSQLEAAGGVGGVLRPRVDGTHVPRGKHEAIMYMYARK